MTQARKMKIRLAMEQMAKEGLRILALAYRERVEEKTESGLMRGLVFAGMAGMIDPPRKEAASSVKILKRAGVKVAMITGDYKETAFAIARKIGIADSIDQCMTGSEIDSLSPEVFRRKIPHIRVFARVTPAHKVKIVRGFQEAGQIVAMTGDGVNDAPSLRAADIGIAMGKNGTDVAKNAADMILTDDNFSTIEKAMEEGRSIYVNIKKAILFLLSSNFGEILTMFVAVLLGLPAPLKASHILWVNLITDSLPALALGVDKNDAKALMSKNPRDPKEGIFAPWRLALYDLLRDINRRHYSLRLLSGRPDLHFYSPGGFSAFPCLGDAGQGAFHIPDEPSGKSLYDPGFFPGDLFTGAGHRGTLAGRCFRHQAVILWRVAASSGDFCPAAGIS